MEPMESMESMESMMSVMVISMNRDYIGSSNLSGMLNGENMDWRMMLVDVNTESMVTQVKSNMLMSMSMEEILFLEKTTSKN